MNNFEDLLSVYPYRLECYEDFLFYSHLNASLPTFLSVQFMQPGPCLMLRKNDYF